MDKLFFNGSDFGYKIEQDETDLRWEKILFISTKFGRYTEWCYYNENIILENNIW